MLAHRVEQFAANLHVAESKHALVEVNVRPSEEQLQHAHRGS